MVFVTLGWFALRPATGQNLKSHHTTGPIGRSRLAMTKNKKFPPCSYMRGSLLAMLGGKCRRCGWVRVVYFWSNFLVKIFGQKFDQKYFPPTFFPESFMIHQRAGWIEDIKLHIDNFCIVWYISIFLLTVAVYYAYTAGFEVWDLRNFLWNDPLIYFRPMY